jgi:AcrR family transcriptional regulator
MPSKPDLYFDSVWMRPPRGRSGQPALSRVQIVRAAIELLDAEGPPGLSMRRLGTRLGSGATSIYWHVANKEELLELAVDEIMGELHVPDAGDTGWRAGVSIYATNMRMMLLRHPWMISQLGSKPTIGPNAMRMGDRMVALLTAAGFTGMDLSHVSSMIAAHSIGSAATQSAVVAATRRAGVPVAKLIQEFEPYLEKVGPEHPHYDKWRRENNLTEKDPEIVWDAGFAFGLDRILDGLELWLAGRSPHPATAPESDG